MRAAIARNAVSVHVPNCPAAFTLVLFFMALLLFWDSLESRSARLNRFILLPLRVEVHGAGLKPSQLIWRKVRREKQSHQGPRGRVAACRGSHVMKNEISTEIPSAVLRSQFHHRCLVPQVRVRSLDGNPSTSSGQALGGGTLGLVRRRFLLPDLLLSAPIRSRRFRFLVRNRGESCFTSALAVLSLARHSFHVVQALCTERGELPDASSALIGCRGPSTPRGLHFVKSVLRSG
jgi:hypothetical protein